MESDPESPRAKLDAMMKLAFEFVGTYMAGYAEARDTAGRMRLFEQIMVEFQRSVLPTYQCRHVQFLVFYACG